MRIDIWCMCQTKTHTHAHVKRERERERERRTRTHTHAHTHIQTHSHSLTNTVGASRGGRCDGVFASCWSLHTQRDTHREKEDLSPLAAAFWFFLVSFFVFASTWSLHTERETHRETHTEGKRISRHSLLPSGLH